MRKAALWSIRALVLLLLSAAALPILALANQWIVRWDANRLLADVRQLDVPRSTWEDFQRFQAKWGRWARYEGKCSPDHCLYSVAVTTRFLPLPYEVGGQSAFPHLCRWLDKMGVRPAGLLVYVEVRRAHLVLRSAEVSIADGAGERAEVAVMLRESSRLLQTDTGLTAHPFHAIHTTARGAIIARVTPDERPELIDEWLHFHLECMTALHPCQSSALLQPALARAEKADGPEEEWHGASCSNPLWVRARDAWDIFSAVVTRLEVLPVSYHGKQKVIELQPLQVLKGGYESYALRRQRIAGPPETEFPYAHFVPGEHLLVLWNPVFESPDEPIDMELEAGWCGALEDTPANRAQVAEGVKKDFDAGEP